MNKTLTFLLLFFVCIENTYAVSRSFRQGGSQQHVSTTVRPETERKAKNLFADKKVTSRSATTQKKTVARSGQQVSRTNQKSNVISRAAVDNSGMRTGESYERCKSAFFTCMDQFCELKNDNYRRCSCSDRVTSLRKAQSILQQAGDNLNSFSENLNIVGMTREQATAINTESEGESAFTKDKSASKALLEAIMNSIRGADSSVTNEKFADLNSVNLSFDSSNAFSNDVGQNLSMYNGQELYSSVYPQCRKAVQADCGDAALQRAVNAYLMAIEQDCNTVQTVIINTQKTSKAAIREGNAMLDLARIENRQNHNSDDRATCLANVEQAVLSEEVCGAEYHKCLDNGEFIDTTTGKPIQGIKSFYKLAEILQFKQGTNNADQKLSKIRNNLNFLNQFEKRAKPFAEPALDKCSEIAEEVWADYLDKALLDIYYAQRSKVNEIKQGCFDFVSNCYINTDGLMTDAMKDLANTTLLEPDKFILNNQLCSDYIESCNNMFDGNIVSEYINNRQDTDVFVACRAILKQCFNTYGGQNYENFYLPSSGLFVGGMAPDWFSLYSCSLGTDNVPICDQSAYISPCAQELSTIDSCKDKDIIERAFGGFDKYIDADNKVQYKYIPDNNFANYISRNLRYEGIATEVYNNIIDNLENQCSTLNGKFLKVSDINTTDTTKLMFNNSNLCLTAHTPNNAIGFIDIQQIYNIAVYHPTGGNNFPTSGIGLRIFSIKPNITQENICPQKYDTQVDTQSWGICSCFANGRRRSNNGTSPRCVATYPVRPLSYEYTSDSQTIVGASNGIDNSCVVDSGDNSFFFIPWGNDLSVNAPDPTAQDWCTLEVNKNNVVCPIWAEIETNNVIDSNGINHKGECKVPYCTNQEKVTSGDCHKNYTYEYSCPANKPYMYKDTNNDLVCMDDNMSSTVPAIKFSQTE